jgi:hypothetical protein
MDSARAQGTDQNLIATRAYRNIFQRDAEPANSDPAVSMCSQLSLGP